MKWNMPAHIAGKMSRVEYLVGEIFLKKFVWNYYFLKNEVGVWSWKVILIKKYSCKKYIMEKNMSRL